METLWKKLEKLEYAVLGSLTDIQCAAALHLEVACNQSI